MNLRDKFALGVLPALITEPEWQSDPQSAVKDLLMGVEDPLHVLGVADRYAIAAYLLADAMMRARKFTGRIDIDGAKS